MIESIEEELSHRKKRVREQLEYAMMELDKEHPNWTLLERRVGLASDNAVRLNELCFLKSLDHTHES